MLDTTYYYAQTFATDPSTGLPSTRSLLPLVDDPHRSFACKLVVYIASLHVGTDPITRAPYLHLNDTDVRDLVPFFDSLCALVARCRQEAAKGKRGPVELRVMLGGAGGAYTALFADFEPRYALLRDFLLAQRGWVDGLDLDIEEPLADTAGAALDRVCLLVRRLDADVPTAFSLTLAPVAYSLTDDEPGLGGFVYSAFARTPEAARIAAYNVQAYGCFSAQTFREMVRNGFGTPACPVVMGMLGDECADATSFGAAMTELQTIVAGDRGSGYPKGLHGAILWEFGDTRVDGVVWGQAVRRAVAAGVAGKSLATIEPACTVARTSADGKVCDVRRSSFFSGWTEWFVSVWRESL